MKIYIPENDYSCVIYKDNTLKGYKTNNINENNQVDIYFTNEHYIKMSSVENIEEEINCIDNKNLTDIIWYRNDISQILIIFVILSGFIVYLPIKILFRLFRRFN